MPDENTKTGSVVLLSAEDDLSDTIVPRLLSHDADLDRIVAIEGVNINDKQAFFSLARDLPALDDVIKQTDNVKLVVIDPLTAFCGSTDSHKNTEVRGLLAPVAQLAAKYDVAVVGVSHLRKGEGRAIYRTLGSLAFVAAARAVWLVTKDANDEERRLLTPVKNNLAVRQTSLAFRIVDGIVEFETTPLQITSDQALSSESQDERSALGEAVEWLQQVLEGGPMNKRSVSELAQKDGIADRTLRRAADKLGVVKKREGFGEFGVWRWQLPEGP
jgi:putative DNA primase/helicase